MRGKCTYLAPDIGETCKEQQVKVVRKQFDGLPPDSIQDVNVPGNLQDFDFILKARRKNRFSNSQKNVN